MKPLNVLKLAPTYLSTAVYLPSWHSFLSFSRHLAFVLLASALVLLGSHRQSSTPHQSLNGWPGPACKTTYYLLPFSSSRARRRYFELVNTFLHNMGVREVSGFNPLTNIDLGRTPPASCYCFTY
ncbi:hypothetical protein OBBRIDRAFT_328599 [Obba rivulosa]|uniref:Uncharacterized protein n=1 Tax=Obba rivulosa TaxID=1052685 RepID=A0A8E2DPH6_9APHY|nr:hypothetical protein OBBRIDRAFT_328599 [Obba rivulosa]